MQHNQEQNMQQLKGLITLPKSLFLYYAWVGPAGMENAMKESLLRVDQSLVNVFIVNNEEAGACLSEPLKGLLLTGLPNEHILQVNYDEEGLPDGATKLLFGMS